MLLAYERLLDVDTTAFVFVLAALGAFLVGTTFHEFSHAASALALGDPTAQAAGRVTLNPIAHLDPLGTILLVVAGFGWGKPVPVNPYRLRGGLQASAMVSFAGPLANFIVAGIATLILLGLPSPYVIPSTPAPTSQSIGERVTTWVCCSRPPSSSTSSSASSTCFRLLLWTASRSHSAFCPATSRSNTARPSNTGRVSCSSLSSSYLSCSAEYYLPDREVLSDLLLGT